MAYLLYDRTVVTEAVAFPAYLKREFKNVVDKIPFQISLTSDYNVMKSWIHHAGHTQIFRTYEAENGKYFGFILRVYPLSCGKITIRVAVAKSRKQQELKELVKYETSVPRSIITQACQNKRRLRWAVDRDDESFW